jgi:hypothetical protein
MTARTDETSATSNDAALRFRLRAAGIADLPDYAALRRFAAREPDAFARAMLEFARLPRARAPLVPALAAVLLEADLRPDDRVLVAGIRPWPWLAARTQGISVLLAGAVTAGTLRAAADADGASVVAAPPAWLQAAGLTDAPDSGPRGLCLEGWSNATAEAMPGWPTPRGGTGMAVVGS